jgi:hypothetical protein
MLAEALSGDMRSHGETFCEVDAASRPAAGPTKTREATGGSVGAV